MKARILVYVSSATAVPLCEGGSHATGVCKHWHQKFNAYLQAKEA